MAFFVRDAGSWKEVLSQGFFVRDAGSWKEVQKAWVYDAGSWKEFYVSFEVDWTGANVSDTQTDPTNATAILAFLNDGTGWGDPEGVGTPGDDYLIRLDVTSGDSPTGGPATGAQHALSTSRTWTLTRAIVGTSSGTWRVRIYHTSDTGTAVADASATVTATVDP